MTVGWRVIHEPPRPPTRPTMPASKHEPGTIVQSTEDNSQWICVASTDQREPGNYWQRHHPQPPGGRLIETL